MFVPTCPLPLTHAARRKRVQQDPNEAVVHLLHMHHGNSHANPHRVAANPHAPRRKKVQKDLNEAVAQLERFSGAVGAGGEEDW